MPTIPKAQTIMVPVPPLNSRRRNIARATIGRSARASMTRKAAVAAAATANAPRIGAEVQPLALPWISA
jgi:hypothetical protein